ncbi:MAG TPA: 2-phospho-L-lactate transferase CofD family protein [Rhizomicrobium sp.]|nr:2-phospho-L-lactate transferase CofD family protein [Rhizomicrobium sp.]
MSAPGGTKIVLFCGGRGSATIIRALLRQTDVDLSLIVNAYDDGLSTGALRNFIPGMLGPSDFRKNLSYLLGNYSHAQYALRSLMEYRLPTSSSAVEIEKLAGFARSGNLASLDAPLQGWFAQLSAPVAARLRDLLGRFFDHAAAAEAPFDYRDCSLGNLVFAGAYLRQNRNFNAAAAEVGDLVGSRARLLNVSDEQNRVLAGLKQDGTFLASEAEIVGLQSPSPIEHLYLLRQPLTSDETQNLAARDLPGKHAFLAERDAVPALSLQAASALAAADIILYGPGTQHSSLFPSYRIARAALGAAPAKVKAMVMNLDSDHDIQTLSASDILNRARGYGAVVTHVLLDKDSRVAAAQLMQARDVEIVQGSFSTRARPQAHNGTAIADAVLPLQSGADPNAASVEIFADIHNRSVASDELVEEFLEADWQGAPARLVLNRVSWPEGDGISTVQQEGLFPETGYLRGWLRRGTSDYLVLMTGDGAYRFRDVQAIIGLLQQQQSLGGVFGSRTQSRRQFITSIQAAYGEKRLLYWLGKAAAFSLSLVFYMRTGVIFSDPLTGLRVFRRQSLAHLPDVATGDAPLAVVRRLIRHGVEVAELPVVYRTYSGFTDPNWRIKRGLRNLAGLL